MINLGSSLMNSECRDCGEVLSFTLSMLTRKAKFKCPNCNSPISLNMHSHYYGLEIPDEVKRRIKYKDFSSRLN